MLTVPVWSRALSDYSVHHKTSDQK